jgi:arginyl-tRNA synthetase
MNIFRFYKDEFSKLLKDNNYECNYEKLSVDSPRQSSFGDLAFNAPLIFSSSLKKNPLDIGAEIADLIKNKFPEFESIEVAKPGFVNLRLKKTFWFNFLSSFQDDKGKLATEIKKINIEYVSANPTGPLHVGHCRGAVYGDVLANLLSFIGNNVTKEYYINDYGNQIHMFAKSVYARLLEIKENIKFPLDQGLYPGDYLKDIAHNLIQKNAIKDLSDYDLIKDDIGTMAMREAMVMIKSDLLSLGIKHDLFVSEKELVGKDLVAKTIKILDEKDCIYEGILPKPKGNDNEEWEERNQLLFKSTKFGDDVDRALKKSDGTWTYFANDVAYHAYKLERKFDKYINVLGADHSGYLKRLKACMDALSDFKTDFECKVCQLVKLFKSGEPYKMSKRAGDFITAKELVEAVGVDAVRFMMIYRSNDSQLDFDFDLVTEKTKENPVFYVQYASARIHSILRKVELKKDDFDKKNLNFLDSEAEIDLIKKLSLWSKCLELSSNNLEPHRIPYYLYDLASSFHSYWNLGKENNDFRIIENENMALVHARVFLLEKVLMVIKSGLSILGVSAPDSM